MQNWNLFQQKQEDIQRMIAEIENTLQKRHELHEHIMNVLEQDEKSITELLYGFSETRTISKDVLENELYNLQHEKRTEQRLYLQDVWNLKRELLEKEKELHELERKIALIVNCVDQSRIDAIHDLENCAKRKQNSAILNMKKIGE